MPVPTRVELADAHPEVARKLFRTGEYFKTMTSGMCQGYVQVNLLALEKSLAEDFSKFCAANSGPLPLLYQSEIGQFSASGITQTDSDIRTDLPAYNIIEDGVITQAVKDIMGYKELLKDFVFFYQGCSFSFDQALLDAGVPLRNLEQSCGVSILKTSVKCHPVGPFKCQMCVSMKPIPRGLVETAFRITHPLRDFHGAPIHIGFPALIGIQDMSKTESDDSLTCIDGDVPVFWACGATVKEAAKSAKPALAFSHYPSSMYIADTPVNASKDQDDSSASIKVISLTENPYWASVTSKTVVQKIKQLEGLIAEDFGKRQVGNLDVSDNLLKSTLALSHASSVAVATNVCFLNNENPQKDDGPPGAIALAMMLQALGRKVDLVVDKGMYGPLTALLEAMLELKVLHRPISLVQFPPEGEQANLETAHRFLLNTEDGSQRYDHLLAIDKEEKAEDVGRLDGIDWLFVAAANMSGVSTAGVGGGSNELDLGKVKDIHRDIPHAPTIACLTAFNFLVTTRVSNWGSYATAVALYLVGTCPIHDRYQRRSLGFPPSEEDREQFKAALPGLDREERMLRILINHKFYDTTGTDVLRVDVHVKKIQQLLGVIGDM